MVSSCPIWNREWELDGCQFKLLTLKVLREEGLLGEGTVGSKRWLLKLNPSGYQRAAVLKKVGDQSIGDDQGKIGQN